MKRMRLTSDAAFSGLGKQKRCEGCGWVWSKKLSNLEDARL